MKLPLLLPFWAGLMALGDGASLNATEINRDMCEPQNQMEMLVCDPDNVITQSQVSELEEIIVTIRNDTTTSCPNSTNGYIVRVIFYGGSTETDNDSSLMTSEDLRNKALVQHNLLLDDIDCDTDILILISHQIKQAVSVAGQYAIPHLPDNVQSEIIANAESLLEESDFFGAASYILRHFGDVLRKTPLSTVSPSFSSHPPKVSQASRRALTIVSVVSVLTIALLGLGGCIYRWKRKPPPHDNTDYMSSRNSIDTLDAFTTIELTDVATSKENLEDDKSEEIEHL